MNATMGANSSEIIAREKLSDEVRDAMYLLLRENFQGVERKQFEADLREKNWVILIWQGEELIGFSTLLVYESRFENELFTIVYSGDTIVAKEAWGSMALPKAWIAKVNEIRRNYPGGSYYWLLLTSGFRTYRFLPVFWREFYPVYRVGTPPAKQRLLDHLAEERFATQYRDGVVKFKLPQVLAGDLNKVPEGRRKDPHVQFFLERNPGCFGGEELVCLTELKEENLTPAGRRMASQ